MAEQLCLNGIPIKFEEPGVVPKIDENIDEERRAYALWCVAQVHQGTAGHSDSLVDRAKRFEEYLKTGY